MEKVMSSICEYEWKILKDYFEDLYNIDTQEQDAILDGFQRGNYLGGEVKLRKLKNGMDEATGQMIKKEVTESGGCVMCLLRVMLFLKRGGLL